MRRGARIALGAGLALAVALAGCVAAFLWGVPIPGEFLRAPLERALSDAFGVPTRIEGPLKVRTGLAAAASADALVLVDPSVPTGAPLARGIRPAVRIDLAALLRRVVALEEVAGERLELALRRAADGRANWAPLFARSGSGPPAAAFAGIARLRIGNVAGSYRTEGADPVRFVVTALEGAAPLRDPTAARGTATVAGYTVAFDLRSASLAALQAAGAALPLQGTLSWSGARLVLDGKVATDGATFDGAAELAADDADHFLGALGVPAQDAGRLEVRGRLGLTATAATASDLTLTLGKSAASGNVRIAWGTPRTRIAAELAGARVDLEPFLSADSRPADTTAAEGFVALLERAATGLDADIKLSVGELAGLPVASGELKLEGRSGDGAVAVRGHGELAGTGVKATLDYDARKPQRILVARLEGGAVSSAKLPGGERPQALSGTTAGIRGQLRGQGAHPRAVVAALQGDLNARDLRWTLAGRGEQPIRGRFDTLRIAVQGARTSSAEVTGKLGDAACTLKVSGGALAPLLEGDQWPVQVAASCTGGRLNAKGRIALAERHIGADLAFDAAADRIGPVAQVFGFAPDAPQRFAARGNLALDEQRARVRLDALRLGRTSGAGQVELPVGGDGTPRVRLVMTTVNLDEVSTLGGVAPTPADPLEREILPASLRLPDADFEVAVDRVEVAETVLRRLDVSGATRANRLPPTRFRIEWEGAPVSGEFGADFSGTAPRVQLTGTAQNVNLGPLVRLGWPGVKLRAGTLKLHARADGTRLGALLAAATLDAALERGRLDFAQGTARGLKGPAEFSATLKTAPGQSAALAARGTVDGEPLDGALDTPGLAGLARTGEAIPATLRVTLGDVRFEVAGKVARDATGEGRVQLSGGRMDRLGKLVGVTLPEVGPYAAKGTVVVTADAIRASDLDVSFGKSRLAGRADFQVKRTGRALHSAVLRAPQLHLEDLGAAQWMSGPAPRGTDEAPAARRAEAEIARALELVRAADADATVEIDALHGGAERFASGRLRATLDAGTLRVLLQDVRTASGTIDADVRVDVRSAQPKLGVRARVNALEFGPLVRTLDPTSQLGGRVDFVADLAAQGPPGELLPALAGTVDAAVFPHDLRPGVLAFWGTGLLSTLLRSLDPNARSEVECAAASVDVKAGVGRTSAFFVDTTRVRIIGQIDANFVTRALAGRLSPVSKQPELFTVAPTMVLGGTIDSPSVSVAPENVVLAPLRFATPLAGFALDWLGKTSRLTAGQVGCREAFERARKLRAAK